MDEWGENERREGEETAGEGKRNGKNGDWGKRKEGQRRREGETQAKTLAKKEEGAAHRDCMGWEMAAKREFN
jgi:hypothetical protein